MSITEIKKKLKPLCKEYEISYLGVFGSYARGEQKKKSDLDLLVEFNKKISLFDLVHIERELSKKIGIKVDLVTKGALHPELKKYVEKDLKEIT